MEVARELEGQLVCVVRSGDEQEHRLWRLLLPEGLQVGHWLEQLVVGTGPVARGELPEQKGTAAAQPRARVPCEGCWRAEGRLGLREDMPSGEQVEGTSPRWERRASLALSVTSNGLSDSGARSRTAGKVTPGAPGTRNLWLPSQCYKQ